MEVTDRFTSKAKQQSLTGSALGSEQKTFSMNNKRKMKKKQKQKKPKNIFFPLKSRT
jgi:hypothetical protein